MACSALKFEFATDSPLEGDGFEPSGVFALCSVTGPVLGGVITDALSWRWIFYVNLPVGMVALSLILIGLPRTERPRVVHRIDYPGAVLLTLMTAALLLLLSGLALGGWRHYQAALEVAAIAQQHQTFVPDVRVGVVRANTGTIRVTLPATTTAFEAANIFARTNGYIEKRYVDIGDRVKAGALLADITAPELDHQIAQAKATLAQNQATLQQTQASRDLAQVTNARDSKLVTQGWLTLQQGDNDRLTLQAQQAAVGVAQSNIAAQEAQIRILGQEKA